MVTALQHTWIGGVFSVNRWRPYARHLPTAALLLIALIMTATTEGFFRWSVQINTLRLASIVGVLAIGQSFVIIGGGFDLSQGAMVCLTAAVAADLAVGGTDPWVAAAAALLLGGMLGAFNGFCVAKLQVNPFVTTLGTLWIYRGAAYVFLDGKSISEVHAFDYLENASFVFLPLRVAIFLGVALLAWGILRYTVWGRHIYAVGGNAQAARLSGISAVGVKLSGFAVSGVLSGLAAVMLLSWVRVAKTDTAQNSELDSIAAAVVGGISLRGGSGSVWGAVFGAIMLQMLANLLTFRNWPDTYRNIITGGVILVFAVADAFRRNRRDA